MGARGGRYCPYGNAEDVAAFLAPYVEAGCVEFNLIATSPDPGFAVAAAGEVKKLLAAASHGDRPDLVTSTSPDS